MLACVRMVLEFPALDDVVSCAKCQRKLPANASCLPPVSAISQILAEAEKKKAELGEWFVEKTRGAISSEIAVSPADTPYTLFSEEK